MPASINHNPPPMMVGRCKQRPFNVRTNLSASDPHKWWNNQASRAQDPFCYKKLESITDREQNHFICS